MKTLKTLMVVILVLSVAFLLVQPVDAQGHGGGGHARVGGGYRGGFGHGYYHGFYGRFGYGWWGYPYWWDYPYYPYYYPYSYPYYDPYYDGGYGEPPVPPQGVTPPAESGQQQPSYWHFCQNPEGYYPYVKECPGGWMKVVPPKPNAAPPSTLGAPVLPVTPPGKKTEK
ncbi:MAG: hypothetical protein ACLQGU_22330 [bacterium]